MEVINWKETKDQVIWAIESIKFDKTKPTKRALIALLEVEVENLLQCV